VFDLRYHVASLAAVFIALVIGILVGVGLSGRGLLDETERQRLQEDIARLDRESDRQQQRIEELLAAEQYERATYEAVMDGRLDGQRIALVFVGPIDGAARANVEDAIDTAGGTVARTRSLKVPIDALEVQDALADMPDAPAELQDVGRVLAQELLDGGETPLWDELDDLIVLEQPPGPPGPMDGIVIARNTEPQSGATARLLGGFYNGLASAGRPAVAVEPGGTSESGLPVFWRYRFSTVDNVSSDTGRVSLAALLAGARPGRYGLDGEDGYLPPVPPIPRG
jgi:hypothetical protein